MQSSQDAALYLSIAKLFNGSDGSLRIEGLQLDPNQKEQELELLDGLFSQLQGNPSAPRVHKKPHKHLLSEVIEDYARYKRTKENWTEKTEAEIRAAYALFLRVIGDRPIAEIDRDMIVSYVETLKKLPPNLNKKPEFKGKSIAEIISKPGLQPMARNTINKNIARVSSLFNWALTEKKYGLTLNPALKMTVRNGKRAKDERQPFSDEDLRKLFQCEECVNEDKDSYRYWVPLIGLFTGARLNEICQLHLEDIRQEEGIWVFDINEDGPDRKLKTKAARRLIPIHPKLLELGLLEFVDRQRRNEYRRLFPELRRSRDGYGQTASKWFRRYRKRCAIAQSGKVFHSFRHTFVDRLRQIGIPEEQIEAIIGHEGKDRTIRRYGGDYPVKVLFEVVRRLSFDDALSHL